MFTSLRLCFASATAAHRFRPDQRLLEHAEYDRAAEGLEARGGGCVASVHSARCVSLPMCMGSSLLTKTTIADADIRDLLFFASPPPTFPIAVAYVPSAEKQRVEQLQRDARAKRSADNTAYAPKFFKYCRVPIQRPHKVAL